MNNPSKRLSTTMAIAMLGTLLSLTLVIDFLLHFLYEFEVAFFMVILVTIFFKTSLSAIFANAIGFLKILMIPGVSVFAYWIAIIVIWAITLALRPALVKHWWLILIIVPVLSCFLEISNMLFELAITQSWEKARVLYLSRVLRNDILFTAYLILPVLVVPLIWELFAKYKYTKPFLLNKQFLSSRQDKIAFNRYNKNNMDSISPASIRTWKLAFGIETGLVAVVFSFLPFHIINLVGIKGLSLILLIPLAMFLCTPLWRKLKAIIGNHSTIKITSIGLFCMTSATMAWGLSNHNASNFVPVLGLFLFAMGVFIAGIVPFTMEILRSHGLKNQKKYRFELIQICFGLMLIPLPFLISVFVKDTKLSLMLLVGLFSTITLLLACLINFNRKAQIEEVTFKTQPDDFQNLKAHKKYFLFIFSNSFFYAIGEAFTYCAVAFIYIFGKNQGWPINEYTLIGLLVGGFMIRKLAGLLVLNLKISEKTNVLKTNICAYVLIVTGLVFLTIGAVLLNNHSNLWIAYIVGFLLNEVLLGVSLAIMSKTKKITLTQINGRHNNLAMIFDHVLGRGLYSLVIGFIITMIFAFVYISSLMIVIVLSTIVSLAILTACLSILAQPKKPNEVKKVIH
ncbi:hypothetical protein SSABA_v1c05390 [Spiroplasma sabaudiense Ar-1343]|uniref:Uncharacterized protein n=1 Tax=Spiroplasma sabaudiense Ar-1343 TaxID=1276257 RepID=W6AAA8_9MOLU|nr:hypothetical protein [Spiroplasma sabaudiense]AHI53946.1 hypothetical protein SSABA_v1c05390 [Spiroplasma sabaudiense Ar-1343]